jgi:hypothetical protein
MDLENSVRHDIARARIQVRALIGGEIKMLPQPQGHLAAELQGDYAGLVRLVEGSKLSLVSGVGFEPTTFRL